MRTRTFAAVAAAGAATLGGATTLALGADDPKTAKQRATRVARLPAPAPVFVRGGFMPDTIGLDQTLGQELATELGLEQEKVDAALRKVIEKRLNAHRDRVLACFDDPGRCGGLERPELTLPQPAFLPPDIIPRPRRRP